MSVESYLQDKAAAATLSSPEITSINTSISNLQSNLNSYFTNDDHRLAGHFMFGSATRGTILPRRIDEGSDIDYMVVFEKGGFQPQTYLDRLGRFAEQRYSRSESGQSRPTIVLELNHIKFDLVPALYQGGTSYYIPDGRNSWMSTNPNAFNTVLEANDAMHSRLLRPTIRLAKTWNLHSGGLFDSFLFEQWICGLQFQGCRSQTDYFFHIIDKLQPTDSAQWKNMQINHAKQVVQAVRSYLGSVFYLASAEQEVQKLIP